MDLAREAKDKIPRANSLRTPEMPSARLILVRMRISPQLLGDPNYNLPGECQQFFIRGHAPIDALPA